MATNEEKKANQSGLFLIIGVGLAVLLVFSAVGYLAYSRFFKDKVVQADASTEIQLGAYLIPLYPGAISMPPPDGTTEGDQRVFFQAPATPDEISVWYKTALLELGLVKMDDYQEDEMRVAHFTDNNGTAFNLFTWQIDEETGGFNLLLTENDVFSVPAAVTIVPSTITPIPTEAVTSEAAAPTATSTVAVLPAPTLVITGAAPPLTGTVQFTINSDKPILKAGTITKYKYTLELIGPTNTTSVTTTKAKVYLPEGITFLQDDYPMHYDPAKREVSWKITWAGAHKTVLTVVTDQFIKPGELTVKAYAYVEDGDSPVLAVHQILVAK